jgi:hypothetical protein
MAELEIPDEARRAAWDEFWYQSTAGADPEQSLSRAVHVAVPLAVAAELDRLAGQWDAERRDTRQEGDMRMATAIGYAIRCLRTRARQLRGQA